MRILSRFFGKKGRDKRKKVRVPVGFDLLYHVKGKKEIELEIGKREICTHMFDLSEGGMAMWVKEPVEVESEIDITFHVIFKEGQTPPMYAKGVVVYCAPIAENRYRLGINFTKILPEDRAYIVELVKIRQKSKK